MPHDATVRLSWNVAGHEAGEGMGSGGSVSQGAGVFSLTPVPAERIRNWKFIEISSSCRSC